MRNAQTFQRMETPPLRVGDVPFTDGNASFVDRGCALCGWKRRCADVRAGTQAPPLPFLVWFRVPRLPEEAPPTDKNKKRLPEEAPPTDKNKKRLPEEAPPTD